MNHKRTFPRYLVKDSSAVILTPGNIISYCILDISKSGLAFCYNGKSNKSEVLKNVIATFFTEHIGTSNISVQIVCDTELSKKNIRHQSEANISKKPYLRRCGIKFNQLSQEQENVISGYIQHLSIKTLPDFNCQDRCFTQAI